MARMGPRSRTALIDFAEGHQIPVPGTRGESPYSTDRNLLHISSEGRLLEDPWTEPPPKMSAREPIDPVTAPDAPRVRQIEYKAGDPVAVEGRARCRPPRC